MILEALVAGAAGDAGFTGRGTSDRGGGAGPRAVRIVIDVPETNPEALAMVGALGMEPSFEVARMYSGPVRDVDYGKMFGLTTLELG